MKRLQAGCKVSELRSAGNKMLSHGLLPVPGDSNIIFFQLETMYECIAS